MANSMVKRVGLRIRMAMGPNSTSWLCVRIPLRDKGVLSIGTIVEWMDGHVKVPN